MGDGAPGKTCDNGTWPSSGISPPLLGLVVGLAAATLFPVDYQFVGFWAAALVAAWVLYWPLHRWHRGVRRASGSR